MELCHNLYICLCYTSRGTWLEEGTKEMFSLMMHSTFYLWLIGIRHIVKQYSDSERKMFCYLYMSYSFQLAARGLLYASSHRQGHTYHSLCYTSRGALAGTRNSSKGPPWRTDLTTHCKKYMYMGVTKWALVCCRSHGVDHWAISRSSQCSTTGVTKAVVCAILSVGWCI